MPGERLSMRKIREVLRLRFAQGLSQRAIGGRLGLSAAAVNAYLNRARFTGRRTVIIDTDPQGSAGTWGEARQAPAPVVATADVSALARVLAAARTDGMDLAIIDSAPHAAPAAGTIARAVDLIVIPVRPAAFDLAAVESAARIVKAAGTRAVMVLSACPIRAPEIAETRAALAGFGLPVAPAAIHDRRAYARAVATGAAVTEFDAGGKAAAEIRELWTWLWEQMS
jgi:chromosome partitioning protein